MMLATYQSFGLGDFIHEIRRTGRYTGLNGLNLLTNVATDRQSQVPAVRETIRRAEQAGYRSQVLAHLKAANAAASDIDGEGRRAIFEGLERSIAGATALPAFESALPEPGLGLARGLNPYTDWALARLGGPPKGWLLIMGLDWYPISDLGDGADWDDYLDHPFDTVRHPKDLFWHNTWAWMLDKRAGKSWADVTAVEAEGFLVDQGIGVIYHNLIPYLRPPGVGKSDDRWPMQELKRPGMRAEFVADLKRLREGLAEPVIAVCTSAITFDALVAGGFERSAVTCWKAHPSRVFHPSTVKDMLFRQVRSGLPT